MTQRFFVDAISGTYLGAYDGPDDEMPAPFSGQKEVVEPPPSGNGSQKADPLTGEWLPLDVTSALDDLFPKEFWRGALNIGVTEDGLIADIDALELSEAEKEDLRIAVRKSTSFKRTDPDLIFMLNAKGFVAEQIDTLWLWVLAQREPAATEIAIN